MKAVILHSDGRRTDLSCGVDPDTYAELESTSYSLRKPALWCGSCGSPVYIRHGTRRKDELYGVHHDAGSCPVRLVISPAGMSDEHKCQAEYQAVAARHAGHDADLEVTTTGRTRVDVVIDGTVGIEVQRSALSKAAAADRTARSIAAGLRSVTWFTARTSDPQWIGHVPGYRTTTPMELWKHLPKPRSAPAAGLRIVEAVRCGERRPCTHQRGTCPRYVPWDAPWHRLLVDDVVDGLATGQILPVRLGKFIQLLSRASISLYEELTGKTLSYDPGQPKVTLAPTDRLECDRGLRIPASAPPEVRAWLQAEQLRVAQQHTMRARALHDEQIADEHAQRHLSQPMAMQTGTAISRPTGFSPDAGACAICGQTCTRYGPRGNPLCSTCRTTKAQR